jgi:hypothetical protein
MKHTRCIWKGPIFLFFAPIALLPFAMPPTAVAASSCSLIVYAGAGPRAKDVESIVDEFRTALGGPDNGGVPGSHPTGFREINWDAVPDEFAAPSFLPSAFFNVRGAFLATPGAGVQVSADGDNPAHAAVRFGHINPTYSRIFKTFTKERLFSPIGSNIVDLTFFVPGTALPAAVRGFGAVYTDVDQRESSFSYFDKEGQLLGQFTVPPSNKALSFLGVVFNQAVVARVRIEYGTTPLGPNDSGQNDVAVMDNFIYGEPQVLP